MRRLGIYDGMQRENPSCGEKDEGEDVSRPPQECLHEREVGRAEGVRHYAP